METQILKLCGDLAPLVRQHFATTLPQSDHQFEMHRYQLTMYHGADHERKVCAAYQLARDAYALARSGESSSPVSARLTSLDVACTVLHERAYCPRKRVLICPDEPSLHGCRANSAISSCTSDCLGRRRSVISRSRAELRALASARRRRRLLRNPFALLLCIPLLDSLHAPTRLEIGHSLLQGLLALLLLPFGFALTPSPPLVRRPTRDFLGGICEHTSGTVARSDCAV